jgi:hypothetical protein
MGLAALLPEVDLIIFWSLRDEVFIALTTTPFFNNCHLPAARCRLSSLSCAST